LEEISAATEKNAQFSGCGERELRSLQYDIGAQKIALVDLAKGVDNLVSERLPLHQRQVEERLAKTETFVQQTTSRVEKLSNEKLEEQQRWVEEKTAKTGDVLARMMGAQEEMKKAMRELAEFLGRQARTTRRTKTRAAAPALPAAPGEVGSTTTAPPPTHFGNHHAHAQWEQIHCSL